MAELTIVTASNGAHLPLVQELIASIRAFPEGRDIPISLLDVGLADADRDTLRPHVAALVDPGWDLDFTSQGSAPEWFKALFCRPFIPRHFPGHDIYLWLDADMWVQDWEAIRAFVRAARRGSLAAIATTDRSFAKLPSEQLQERLNLSVQWWTTGYGQEIARRHYMRPSINGGAFALASSAPHWQEWRQNMAVVIQKFPNFMLDQITMNYVIYERGLPFASLPMTCNWMCNVVMPQYDVRRGAFVSPEEPHERIGIMHLSGAAKRQGQHVVETIDGGRVEMSLRYGAPRPAAESNAPVGSISASLNYSLAKGR